MRALNGNVIKNIVAGMLVGYGIAAFFLFFILDFYWTHIAPPEPDSQQGFVFGHNEHGAIVYFSAFQSTSCALLFATSIPLVFIGVAIFPKANVQSLGKGFLGRIIWDYDDPSRVAKWGAAIGSVLAPIVLLFLGAPFVHWLNRIGFV